MHADFECNLESVESYEGSYSKKYQDHIPCSFAYKLVCVDDEFTKPIVAFRGKNAAYEFIKAILEEHKYCKKIMKKHFNKNLIMTEEEEHLFQKSNNCWICKKFINNNNNEEKVRDHCHVAGEFRGAAHQNCNVNFQLTEKVPVIFHNLRGYDSDLIFYELKKFDVKIDLIPNRLEKYGVFILRKILVFIDSMQFMKSNLEKLVKNVSDNDLKYLTQEFGFKNVELLKQRDAYPNEYMNSFKKIFWRKITW